VRFSSVRTLVIALAVVAVAVFGTPAAYAAGDQKTIFSDGSTQWYGPGLTGWPLGTLWEVGDCRLLGYVEVLSDRVHLHATTMTKHTNHADVWHSYITFYDANGHVVIGPLGGSRLDSPQMVPAGGRSSGPSEVYTWDRDIPLPHVAVSTPSFRVIWQSSC